MKFKIEGRRMVNRGMENEKSHKIKTSGYNREVGIIQPFVTILVLIFY